MSLLRRWRFMRNSIEMQRQFNALTPEQRDRYEADLMLGAHTPGEYRWARRTMRGLRSGAKWAEIREANR